MFMVVADVGVAERGLRFLRRQPGRREVGRGAVARLVRRERRLTAPSSARIAVARTVDRVNAAVAGPTEHEVVAAAAGRER